MWFSGTGRAIPHRSLGLVVAGGSENPRSSGIVFPDVMAFLVWCVLFVLCWPLALLALGLYPIVWLLLLPFRIVGIAVEGVLELVRGIVMLPAQVLRGRRAS